jgi:hypothetical protein
MDDLLGLGVFTLLGHTAMFHILGGGALGIGSRQLRNARLSGGRRTIPFLMFWGVLFGAIPLALGAVLQDWALLAGQGAILVASFAITFFLSEPARDFVGRQYVFMIGFGALFMVAGGVTTWLMLRGNTQTVSGALTFGSLFYLVGTLALAAGLAQWVRGPKLGRKEQVVPNPKPVIPEPKAPVAAKPAGPTFVTTKPAADPVSEPVGKPVGPSAKTSFDILSPGDVSDMLSPVEEPKPPEDKR